MSAVDVVESRISAIQSALAALAAGQAPSSSSGAAFSSVLASQTDVSVLMDQAGGGDLDSTDPNLVDESGDADGSATTAGSTSSTSSSSGPTGLDVVADAKRYLGVPYKWGGTDPDTGLDCSGLVQRVMKDLGVSLPRTVSQQRNSGTEVDSMKDAKPGDLLVFGSHHIGIYLGHGKMLHAPHTGDHVRISDVYETPTRIRRVVPATDTTATASTGSVRPESLRQSGSGSHQYDALFQSATQKYHLPSGLLRAVASVESSFNAKAVSPAGAEGLMQLMPGTARGLGVDAMNPSQAVDGAGRMLSGLIKEFGSTKLALAAYNAGAGAVKKYGGVPPYNETQSYVRKVMSRMEG